MYRHLCVLYLCVVLSTTTLLVSCGSSSKAPPKAPESAEPLPAIPDFSDSDFELPGGDLDLTNGEDEKHVAEMQNILNGLFDDVNKMGGQGVDEATIQRFIQLFQALERANNEQRELEVWAQMLLLTNILQNCTKQVQKLQKAQDKSRKSKKKSTFDPAKEVQRCYDQGVAKIGPMIPKITKGITREQVYMLFAMIQGGGGSTSVPMMPMSSSH